MSGWSHPVASFWAGKDLSFVEQMVIRSYLDQGCDFTLYLGHPVGGIPEGTPTRDASEIMPVPDFLDNPPTRKQLAVWSDLFRLHLLTKTPVIWVDLDAYCVRPYDLPRGYGFGCNDRGDALSGVLALPQESAALAWMKDFVSGPELSPPWASPARIERRRRRGALGPADLPWGNTGPRLLEHALTLTGEKQEMMPAPVFYPVFGNTLPHLLNSRLNDQFIRPETLSVHIFGYTKRVLATYCDGLPPPGSWLARAAERHNIDPAAAPVVAELLPQAKPKQS